MRERSQGDEEAAALQQDIRGLLSKLTKGLEKVVANIVRPSELVKAFQLDKSRRPAPVRDIIA